MLPCCEGSVWLILDMSYFLGTVLLAKSLADFSFDSPCSCDSSRNFSALVLKVTCYDLLFLVQRAVCTLQHNSLDPYGEIERLFSSSIGFGLALAEICQTFGQQQCQEDMTCPKSTTQSLHNMVTSLFGNI